MSTEETKTKQYHIITKFPNGQEYSDYYQATSEEQAWEFWNRDADIYIGKCKIDATLTIKQED
jgi:hypothetical protein